MAKHDPISQTVDIVENTFHRSLIPMTFSNRPPPVFHPSHHPPLKPACAFTTPASRIPPTNNLLNRFLKLPQRLRRWPPSAPKSTRPKPTSQEWGQLIQEFEDRSRTPPPPPRCTAPVENPDQYAMLPHTESAFMVALTTVLWWMGRMLRLDSFLLLFYPLPNMYIAARHGLSFSNYTLASTLVLVFSLVGPLYAVLYFLNTGLLTMAYARALWYRWPWWAGLMAGGVAKTAGLVLQLWFMSGILKVNTWYAVGVQVTTMLNGMCQLLGRVGLVVSPPGMRAVQIGVAFIVALHSFYHVFFAQLSSTLMLRRMSEHEDFVRVPPEMPLVRRLLQRARRP